MSYLQKKIEENRTGAFFNRLCFIGSEIMKDKQSDIINDFAELNPIDICNTLGWNTKPKTINIIEDYDGNFHEMFIQFRKFGFLAEVFHPVHFDFSDRGSCSVSSNEFRIKYLYAETMGELVYKLELQALEMYQEFKNEG